MVVFPQADGRLYVSRSLDRSGHLETNHSSLTLDDFAQPIQFFDEVTVYQVSPLRLRELARGGRSAGDVLQYLRQIAQAPIPIQVQHTIIAEMKSASLASPEPTVKVTPAAELAIDLRQEKALRAYQYNAVQAFLNG